MVPFSTGTLALRGEQQGKKQVAVSPNMAFEDKARGGAHVNKAMNSGWAQLTRAASTEWAQLTRALN